jgi:hypothetical protein
VFVGFTGILKDEGVLLAAWKEILRSAEINPRHSFQKNMVYDAYQVYFYEQRGNENNDPWASSQQVDLNQTYEDDSSKLQDQGQSIQHVQL